MAAGHGQRCTRAQAPLADIRADLAGIHLCPVFRWTHVSASGGRGEALARAVCAQSNS
jgi:hypothetical protein